MKVVTRILVLSVVALLFAVPVLAETYTLTPSDDMYTDPDNPGTHSASELWTADWAPTSNYQRIIMKFDLSTLQGLTVESATLNLYRFFGCPSGDPTTTAIYHITEAWSEDSWPENQHVANGDNVWANYVFSVNGWQEINITSLVQSWVNGETTNHGLVIIASNSKFSKCYSKESPDADMHPFLQVEATGTGVEAQESSTIHDFELQTWPNPFNSTVNIEFALARTQVVEITVRNLLGETVATLSDGMVSAGQHTFSFQADQLCSGTYFVQMRAGNQRLSRKVILVK